MNNQEGSLAEKAASGTRWFLFEKLSQRMIALVTTVVLARILLPEDFGLFTLGMISVEVVGYAKSLGVDAALVHNEGKVEELAPTAFWLVGGISLLFFALIYLCAPGFAFFFDAPSLAPLVRTLSLLFMINAFGRVPSALLDKYMMFRQKTISEILGQVVHSVATIGLALKGFGVWSLVVGHLVQQSVIMVVMCYSCRWRPQWSFNRGVANQLLSYGKFVAGNSIIGFFADKVDKIVIGRILGAGQLGFYAMAFNLVTIVPLYGMFLQNRILFPAYSIIQKNEQQVIRFFLKSVRYVSVVSFPLFTALPFFAKDILLVIYGKRWLAATAPLQILSIYGLIIILYQLTGPLFRGIGAPKNPFQVTCIKLVTQALVLVPLVYHDGIRGAAIAMCVSALAGGGISLYLLNKRIPFRIRDLGASLTPAAMASLLMCFILGLVKWGFEQVVSPLPELIRLIGMFIAGFATYLIAIYSLDQNIFFEFKRLILRRGPHEVTASY